MNNSEKLKVKQVISDDLIEPLQLYKAEDKIYKYNFYSTMKEIKEY